METEAKMTLTAEMTKHIRSLCKDAKNLGSTTALIHRDLANLSEEQVERYKVAARSLIREEVTDEKERERALGLLSKVVTLFRQSKGWKRIRGKGAGRKAKVKAKDAATAEASVLDQFNAAVNYTMVHWFDVTDDQRKVAFAHLMKRIDEWKAAGFKSKAG